MKRKLCLAANDSFGISIPEQIALFGEIGFGAFFVRWSDQLGVWRDAADRVGLEFQSVHAQNDMTQFLWERSEGSEILVRDWIRCVEDCARIGVPIVVLHPFRGIGKEAEPTPQGVENFKHVVDAAVRHGIKLAVENCEGVQYLSALLNAFPDCENVAFCWVLKHQSKNICGGVFLKNILIVFGGKSCEHDISVITGVLTTNSIDGNLYNKIPVYVSGDGEWFYSPLLNNLEWYKTKDYKKVSKVTLLLGDDYLYSVKGGKTKKLFKIDCAINCMHGVNGEDGSLCGLMKLCNIPLASPDTFTSSFSIDKDVTKIVLKGLNVNCLPHLRIMKDCFFTKKDLKFFHKE